MLINSDFTKRVIVHAAYLDWTPSPIAGVERRMLDRIGDEVARASSIVRYAPGSKFSRHAHDGGEEFFVLEGIFQDEHGDYPAGTYVRNPPTSSHTPGSQPGCTIFVKLHQFDLADRTFARIDTNKIGSVVDGTKPGVRLTPLFEDARESVQFVYIEAGKVFDVGEPDGFEMLVVDGTLSVDGEASTQQTWLRLPAGEPAELGAGPRGAKIWIKQRHLRQSVLKTGAFANHEFGEPS
jgi:hypothetical protein